MTNHKSISLIILLFLLIITTISTASPKTTADDLITRTCQSTPDRSICESSLRADPRSAGALDTVGLIHIMLDIVKSNFSDSLEYVERLEGEAKDPSIKKALKECERRFRVVIEANMVVAVSAVNLGDPKFGENAMTDSAIEAAACKRAINSCSAASCKMELGRKTKVLGGLSSVAAAMIKILE